MKTQRSMYLSIILFLASLTTSNTANEQTQQLLNNLNAWTKPLHTRTYVTKQAPIPLFKQFPTLQTKLPYTALGTLPTPIKKLESLGKQLGAKNLFLKNDGIISPLFSGNKVRKLEFLLADAYDNGASMIITVGDAGSNHSTATAIHAQRMGMKCISLLTPQVPTIDTKRNLLLALAYGGTVHYYPTADLRDAAVVNMFLHQTETEGKFPYFIPAGGSCSLGVVGYVNAAFELKEQIEQGILPEPDHIYVTLASAGTASGLALGLKLAGLKSTLIPICIGGACELREKRFFSLINDTSRLLSSLDASCPQITMTAQDITVNHKFSHKAFALVTPEAAHAVKLLMETENIKIDGTYTGIALAAMVHAIKNTDINNKVILFWDTFCAGSFENITSHIDYHRLPQTLHHYFESVQQPLDQGI